MAPPKRMTGKSEAVVPPRGSAGRPLWLRLGLLVALFGAIAAYLLGGERIGAPPAVQHVVPRVAYRSDPAFLRQLLHARQPVILTGSPAASWEAASKWTPEYLMANVETLKGAYRHAQRVFTFFDDGKPLASLPAVQKDLRAAHKTVDVPSVEFFGAAMRANAGEASSDFLYYSGPLEDFGPTLAAQVEPSEWMQTHEGSYFTMNCWMGYNGTTAHTHYDIFHNFNVQLYGTKRFLLMPPSEWPNLYHYPRIHPMYRQSQVDYMAPDLARFPRFEDVQVHEALMHPGDTLYLPPYWSHRVTSLDLSISVNTFSDTKELLGYYELQRTSLDFLRAHAKDPQQAGAALAHYARTISEHVIPDAAERRHFGQLLYSSRFASLDAVLRGGKVSSFTRCSTVVLGRGGLSDMQKSAQTVARLLEEMPHDIRQISLGNYIEDVARVALLAENVHAFMRDCIQHTL